MHATKIDKLRRYQIALAINLSVWALQSLIFLVWADSKSLLGDALHSLADAVVLLGVVFFTIWELAHPKEERHHADTPFTKGAVILLFVSAGYVFWEGIERIMSPGMFPVSLVVGVTCIAIVGNFLAHRTISGVHEDVHDHKHHASVMHVLADLVISIVVLCSALGTLLFGMPAIDGVGAIIVALWMFWRGKDLWQSTTRTASNSCTHHDH